MALLACGLRTICRSRSYWRRAGNDSGGMSQHNKFKSRFPSELPRIRPRALRPEKSGRLSRQQALTRDRQGVSVRSGDPTTRGQSEQREWSDMVSDKVRSVGVSQSLALKRCCQNAVPRRWRSGHQLVTVVGPGENNEVIASEGDLIASAHVQGMDRLHSVEDMQTIRWQLKKGE